MRLSAKAQNRANQCLKHPELKAMIWDLDEDNDFVRDGFPIWKNDNIKSVIDKWTHVFASEAYRYVEIMKEEKALKENGMSKNKEMMGYERIDQYNPESIDKLSEHYREILGLIGEDPKREGLLDTPMRVAKAMQFFTQGYDHDPVEILKSATQGKKLSSLFHDCCCHFLF